MRSLRKKHSDLAWIHDYRLLKQRKAEQDAQAAVKRAADAKGEHEAAEDARDDALQQCLDLAQTGTALDLTILQIWHAELGRCERRELDTRQALNEAEESVHSMTDIWRRSLIIAERSGTELSVAHRKYQEARQQVQLLDVEELSSARAARP